MLQQGVTKLVGTSTHVVDVDYIAQKERSWTYDKFLFTLCNSSPYRRSFQRVLKSRVALAVSC